MSYNIKQLDLTSPRSSVDWFGIELIYEAFIEFVVEQTKSSRHV